MDASKRESASDEVFERLFGARDSSAPETDPEFMRILRTLIFGDVFATGDLDDATRELITITVLATLQTLPQLRSHTAAALRVGVEPVAIREALYQLAPFIGFPRTLNALTVFNEVLSTRGIDVPLESQATVTSDQGRFEAGSAIQGPLYGTEIADELPEGLEAAVPRFLTEFLFGDIYSRTGLDLATRELLVLVALAALGLERQLAAHVGGALRAGNSRERILAALIHAFPYTGFPAAINAVRVLRDYQES